MMLLMTAVLLATMTLAVLYLAYHVDNLCERVRDLEDDVDALQGCPRAEETDRREQECGW